MWTALGWSAFTNLGPPSALLTTTRHHRRLVTQISHAWSGSSGSDPGTVQDVTWTTMHDESAAVDSDHLISLWIFLVFGIFFYFLVVKKYHTLEAPTSQSTSQMEQNPISATGSACCTANCWLALCCGPSRLGLTFHATGILDFWIAVLLNAIPGISPILTCVVLTSTDITTKLGGERPHCCEACLCSFCCLCCVNVKLAEALDLATEQTTGCLKVTGISRGAGYAHVQS